ncbi:MAG TPA: DUF885 domain-containing protein [Terracidiphilus sp.]|nr:DUF885 domain-containing protein [Terracidiphilus sp.]
MKQLRWFVPALSALLLLAPALRAQSLTAAPAAQASPAERSKHLSDLFHEYWEAYLRYSPETASEIGDNRYNDKISDYSVKAYNDWLAQEQNFLLQLAAISPDGLSDQEKLSRELLLRDLTTDQEASEFKEWEMPVTQMYGSIQTLYPQLVDQLSFKTVKDYDDWIARLHAIPHAFNQVMTNMSIGIDDHRVPPKYLLEKALQQVNDLAGQKPEDSPFAQPLKKFPASIPAAEQQRIKTEMLDAISKEVLPAYVRFGLFLKATYIPAGRDEPGIWALPDGDKYYQFLIRRTTTTDLTAEQIHQIGLQEVQKDEAAMLAIAQKLGFKDLASFRASINANPKLKATSADQLMAAYKGYIDPMRAKLPDLFGRLPKAPLEVVAMPDFVAKTAPPAYYDQGTPDGSRPGRLTVNLYNATDRDLYSVESVAYHEGIPGHHLQLSIAQELTGIPEFRKYEGYTAFVEGWALYAEQLGKDAGFYQDPYSDYGRLQADIWRAIRLVVDTGVHHDHWTRQQMVDFFHAHTAMDETTTQAEVDRYIAWPGQALAYKVGQLTILELRAKAQKALGDKFDIKAFHDEVLDSGALPLDVLASRMDAWIAQQKGQ